MVASVTRSQVLSFRVRAQQLNFDAAELADTAVMDIGVQDTGPDGAGWALSNRGAKAPALVREAITEQAERLAAYRRVPLSGIDIHG